MEEEKQNKEGGRREMRRYCVTGANGYIGSWLVKLLLQSGAIVHATIRHPTEEFVQRHLLPFWEGGKQLKLFIADLDEEGSFDEAVTGCHGVFHVAASMQFHIPCHQTNNIDHYVETNIIGPATKGMLNLLRSCSKSDSVKRVVITSSISTLTAKNTDGTWKRVVDETCQAPIGITRSTRASGWVYALSKLLSEETALKYASENGIDIVSIITSTVAGPFITSAAPSSINVLLSPVTGDLNFASILSSVSDRMGSIALVHIEDICEAHLFLMEHPGAEAGRYLCCSSNCLLSELVDLLVELYPFSNIQRSATEGSTSYVVPSDISSRKLKKLGFVFKHDIRCIIRETINCCIRKGILKA